VPGRYSISFPGRRDRDDPWFRIGMVDVTTTLLVTLLCVVSIFVWAANNSWVEPLYLLTDKVRHGQVWRLVTWPIANTLAEPPSAIWKVAMIAMFWFFGREVERQIGRVRFLQMLLLLAVVPGIVGVILDINQGGIRPLQIAIFVVFAMEHPRMPFFFGLQAWILAAVIVGVEVLQLIGYRIPELIVLLFVSLATAVLSARAFGMLTDYEWLPKLNLPGKKAKSSRRSGGPTVVAGPWSGSQPAHTAADQMELDTLLDKINAGGIDSLSRHEKSRLNELSKKLRGR
jgi:membrane associated rhomboid family serine protease